MSSNKYLFLVLFTIFIMGCKQKKTIEKEEALVVAEVAKLPYFNSALFTPEWDKGIHHIPDFSFTNQIGEQVTNENFEDKIYVADFFFTICPGICSKLTKNMSLLQEEYKNDDNILLLSHTVMPWNDSVDKLANYAKENNVMLPKWNLVTGETEAIYDIARNGYFADEDFVKTQQESDFIHTENFILVDKKGYIRGVYNGTLELEVKRLIRHIEILKKES